MAPLIISITQKTAVIFGLFCCCFGTLGSFSGNTVLATASSIETRDLIVGGMNADPTKYPFYVQMKRGCGASLLSSDTIITAAHCLYTDDESLLVYVSAYNSGVGIKRMVTSMGFHPKYRQANSAYDLAVLKLDIPITSIEPVVLNNDDDLPQTDFPYSIVGMGSVDADSSIGHTTLQEATVWAIDDSKCLEAYGDAFVVGTDEQPSPMICAGWEGGGPDACHGDSGSPLLEGNVLMGVVSAGKGCGEADKPGVYTRISPLRGWIESQVCLMTDYPPSYCGTNGGGETPDNLDYMEGEVLSGNLTIEYNATGLNSTAANAGTGMVLRLDITYDEYSIENKWELRYVDENEVIDSVDFYTFREAGLVSNTYLNLEAGQYSFSIEDYANDGMW